MHLGRDAVFLHFRVKESSENIFPWNGNIRKLMKIWYFLSFSQIFVRRKLLFSCSDENNGAINYGINSNKTTTSKSFEYKTKTIGSTSNDNNILDAEVAIPLKYLSNFWKSLDFPLIKCEIELDLRWTKNCVISEISRTDRVASNKNANPSVSEVAATATTEAKFQVNNVKIYVSVVTLSINDNVKFLENTKQGFKRTISWSKYRSETKSQPKIVIWVIWLIQRLEILIDCLYVIQKW